jgi:hypothetical protein
MNILIITYDWIPKNSIAVHRPYSWAKYWSRWGANVTVLTAVKKSFDAPLDLNLPDIENTKVIEVQYSSFGSLVKKDPKKIKYFFFMRSVKAILYKYLGIDLDPRRKWVSEVINSEIYGSKYDVIISTYPIKGSHLIASRLKKKHPDSFWIADYRDFWSLSHIISKPKIFKYFDRFLENKLVWERADLITVVSQTMALQMKRYFNKRVHVFSNGYDIDTFELMKNIQNSRRCNSNFVIAYTGMIYPGRRDPMPLVNALVKYYSINKGLPKIELHFYGQSSDYIMHNERLAIYDFIHCKGHVSREVALEIQKKSDYLLLLESNKEDAIGVITGKVFEYISSGTPILSLGSSSLSEIAMLLKDTGTGICLGIDEDCIYNELIRFSKIGRPSWYNPKFEIISSYSRESISKDYFNLIVQKLK